MSELSPGVTIVVALDEHHIKEFEIVWSSWIHFHPEIKRMPIVLLCDWDHMTAAEWIDRLHFVDLPDVCVAKAMNRNGIENQREKMLTSFVMDAPPLVKTTHWLKIDTDTIATRSGPVLNPSWLDDSPAIVAQRWGYTKPPDHLEWLDYWAAISCMNIVNPAPIRVTVGNKSKHPRIISWYSIIDTKWSRDIKNVVSMSKHVKANPLPVASQDTFHWYCAYRRGDLIRKVDVKAAGWRHVGGHGAFGKKVDNLAFQVQRAFNESETVAGQR